MGQGTAQAARKAGFGQVIDGGGDAVRLAATMRRNLPQQSRVLYLAGRVRQPVFEDEMRGASLDMHVADVYDTEVIPYSASALLDVLHGAPFVAVMLYSGVAVTSFVEAMREITLPFDEKTRFCAFLSAWPTGCRRSGGQMPLLQTTRMKADFSGYLPNFDSFRRNLPSSGDFIC